jgi:hypothetical protein
MSSSIAIQSHLNQDTGVPIQQTMFGFLEGELERDMSSITTIQISHEGITKTFSFVTVYVTLVPTEVTFFGETLATLRGYMF